MVGKTRNSCHRCWEKRVEVESRHTYMFIYIKRLFVDSNIIDESNRCLFAYFQRRLFDALIAYISVYILYLYVQSNIGRFNDFCSVHVDIGLSESITSFSLLSKIIIIWKLILEYYRDAACSSMFRTVFFSIATVCIAWNMCSVYVQIRNQMHLV